ncbi:MAG: hypothetical protein PHO37_05145 [Kiritimatiellae bacterium]|nr:hypothetical protein [Kiritimatiellia bacterium]
MLECLDLKKMINSVSASRVSLSGTWARYLFMLCFALVLSMVLSGCGCGRKKKPTEVELTQHGIPVAVSRMNDKEYLAALNQHREDQKVVARERNELAEKLKACAERVKAGLAVDVSEEDFKAALEKDEEWQSCKEHQDTLDQRVKDELSDARDTVRARLIKEQVDAAAYSR